jgi:hypothetical protein
MAPSEVTASSLEKTSVSDEATAPSVESFGFCFGMTVFSSP